ncbi:MAG: DUF2922 domain-containing protein [Paraclostridium sp.]
MSVKKSLVLNFQNSKGGKSSLSIDNPKPHDQWLEYEIKDAMELIVEKNAFVKYVKEVVEGKEVLVAVTLTKPLDAKIVVTDTTEYDLIVE